MHKVLEKLEEEFFAVLPPTIFFFVALHIVTYELGRVIGRQKLLPLFFGPMPLPEF